LTGLQNILFLKDGTKSNPKWGYNCSLTFGINSVFQVGFTDQVSEYIGPKEEYVRRQLWLKTMSRISGPHGMNISWNWQMLRRKEQLAIATEADV
jgi:hypothetical protein